MYKVFLNDRLIKIASNENITFNKTPEFFDRNCTPEEIRDWFRVFLQSAAEEAVLLHPDPEYFFRLFRQAFMPVKAAGGVVLSEGLLLFIFRNGKWDLPKGKMEPGEQQEETALREVAEETGITGHRIVRSLPDTWHIYRSPHPEKKEQWILKTTFWYEMEYAGKREGVPQREEGITQVKWIPVAELGEVIANTYESLKQIIQLFAG